MNITWARNKSKHIMSVQLLFFIGPSKSFSCNKSNYVMRNGRRIVVGTYLFQKRTRVGTLLYYSSILKLTTTTRSRRKL